MLWIGTYCDCRMAIDPKTSLMEPGSSGVADITQGIENVTLVRQQRYFILLVYYIHSAW